MPTRNRRPIALPKPAEFYFDADANATKPVVAVRETGEAATAKLLKLIERDAARQGRTSRNLAHLAMAGRPRRSRPRAVRSAR